MTICNSSELLSRIQSQVDSICGLDLTWVRSNSGVNSTIAIKNDGTLWTWGSNINGQLGDGTTVNRCSPGTVFGGGNNWFKVSIESSTAAIKTDGTLWTWGQNSSGQLGTGTVTNRSSPGTVAGGGTTWCDVSIKGNSTAAIKTDGTLWTWGCNQIGQLGDGTTVSRCSPGTVAGGGTNWCQVSMSSNNMNAIKTDGTLWTWGCNVQGELGDGTQTSRSSPGTVAGGGTDWCQVSGGAGFTTAAIKCDGTLWTWGNGNVGRLGDGTVSARCSPGTTVNGGTTWCQVFAANAFMGSIKCDGTLWTWGNNNCGQLGDGTTVGRCSPGTVAGGGTTWCQSCSNNTQVAAIKTDGTLWTWGCNPNGELGNNTTVCRCSPGSLPIQTSTPEDFTLLSAAVAKATTNRQVSVASSNELPDLYDNKISNGTIIFVEQNNLPVISNNECWIGLDGRVLRSDAPTRTLFTWGRNNSGQLGDGTTTNRCSPGTIANGGTTWCQFISSRRVSMAIKTDGTLWTWGDNFSGLLGDGTTVNRCSPGTVAGGGTTWCQVSASGYMASAIKTDGTIWTWGCNIAGELGNGNQLARSSPGTVAGGGTTWCQVSNSRRHSLAIKTDGTLWTWGLNASGRLGNGTIVDRCSPGTVAGGGTTWCSVNGNNGGSDGDFSVVLKTDGTLWTWGSNSGQLGDGTTVSRCSPGTIAGGGTNWCQVSGGVNNISAIKTDGTLWTWGGNTQGVLGDGTTVSRSSPGTVAGGGTTWCLVSGLGIYSNAIFNTSAIKTDGTLWTWGGNTAGILGDGTTVDRCSPGTVAGSGTTWCKTSGLFAITVL